MPILAAIIGAVLGALLGQRFESVVAGAFIGLVGGLVFNSWRKGRAVGAATAETAQAREDEVVLLERRLTAKLAAMERRIASLEAALPAAAVGAPVAGMTIAATDEVTRVDEPTEDATATAAAPEAPTVAPLEVPSPVPSTADDAAPIPAYAAGGGTRVPRERAQIAEPSALWRMIAGGNTLARIGVVVLFIGVAFLLKYATEHVTVPIELRLAGVALGGVALLVLGWKLRTHRAGYAMSLQGAAIGVLYLTVFAALRLYQLLPPLAAFALLFWIAALSSYLAIRQDAMALAVLGIVGGFAAPVLTSSGEGSHVMLFSYYTLLNAGILGIAWFKAWRLLNLVGFACTFIVGTLWGVTRYRPEDFATTEPFLVLFFLFYVGIATLYALRRSLEVKRYVDATLVFATPLFAAGLQSALARRIEYALAWSAIGASAVYLVLARYLYTRHRDDLRLLIESYLALGVVFATLAVPLALDARVTSAVWALEGAALVFVGTRQRHLAPRVFGLVLQVAAGIAFAVGFTIWAQRAPGPLPILNSQYIGALLVAIGGVVTARILARAEDITAIERSLVPVAFAWGVLWWLAAGWQEIERHVAFEHRLAIAAAFVAATAALSAWAARVLAWPLARAPAFLAGPGLLMLALYGVGVGGYRAAHLFGTWDFAGWLFALGVHVALLRHFERVSPPLAPALLDVGHAVLAWLVTLIAAHELAWLARESAVGRGWRIAAWGFAPMLALFAIVRGTLRTYWPMGARVRAWLVIAAIPLVVAALAWALYANVASSGDAAPLPFVPLLNPVDLTQALVFAAIALWLWRVRGFEGNRLGALSPQTLGTAAALLLLFFVTFATLRMLHHWADMPWTLSGMWSARIAQAALALVWTVFALAAMLVANRLQYRAAWVGGAALLAVVVAKLFFVDLSQVGGVERIVSFIGVGVLLLVIGYVAPVPPRREPV